MARRLVRPNSAGRRNRAWSRPSARGRGDRNNRDIGQEATLGQPILVHLDLLLTPPLGISQPDLGSKIIVLRAVFALEQDADSGLIPCCPIMMP